MFCAGKSLYFQAKNCFCLIYIGFASCGDSEINEKFEEAVDESLLARRMEGNLTGFDGLVKSADGKQVYQLDDGRKDGETIGMDSDGRKLFEGNLKDGLEEGLWTTYYSDGTPRWRGSKKNGVNHGPFTMWHPNGKKKMEGRFWEGKKDGLIMTWYPDGKKWQEQSYFRGLRDGAWRIWSMEGELISEDVFSRDQLVADE
tara:strand:- start:530 stop:1129 length:600 start_codon:yes stop_codon:yes gene_type:complete